MTKIQNDKSVWVIGNWEFFGIWCSEFDISEYLNTREGVFIDYLAIVRSKPGTANVEPLNGTGNVQ
jgi:hypothetical protein